MNYSKLNCWLPYLKWLVSHSDIEHDYYTLICIDVLSIILPVLHITKLFDLEPPGLSGFSGHSPFISSFDFNSKISSFVVSCLVISFSWYLCVSWFICAATQINLALQCCRLTSALLRFRCQSSTGTFLDTRISKQRARDCGTRTRCMGLSLSASNQGFSPIKCG